MEQAVTEAVRILREGGVILYPTDTVWGIGCDATNAEAVERIYHLKRSENKKSMLVLCATPDMVVRYVHKAPGIAFEVQELATKGLNATCFTVVNDGSEAAGCVVSASEDAGSMVEVGTTIVLYIAGDVPADAPAGSEAPSDTGTPAGGDAAQGGVEYDTD